MLIMRTVEQVETLLKSQDPVEQQSKPTTETLQPSYTATSNTASTLGAHGGGSSTQSLPQGMVASMGGIAPESTTPQDFGTDNFSFGDTNMMNDASTNSESFPWEMIGLGLEEPLPPQDTIDDLYVSTNQLNSYST
jgi:hypothetical protein